MKKLILPIFEKLLDVIFIICAIFVLLGAIGAAIAASSVLSFFVVLIGGALWLIIAFGMIYIFLDMRADLKRLADKRCAYEKE